MILDAILGTSYRSNNAKNLLRKAGLAAYIPPEGRKKRTNNHVLRWFQKNPTYFNTLLQKYKKKVRIKNRYTLSRQEKREDIKKVSRLLLKKGVKLQGLDSTKTDIALDLISSKYGFFPNTLRYNKSFLRRKIDPERIAEILGVNNSDWREPMLKCLDALSPYKSGMYFSRY